MHYPVIKQSDTLSLALLDCIILHIYDKQFRCSVFTFVQYITNTGITDLNGIELFSQPLHIIDKLGQFIDGWLRMGLLPPPLGNFADISYLVENCKPSLLRDVCTLCSGALVCKSL